MRAQVVLPCSSPDVLEATLAFFCEGLAFRVAAVFPADAPRTAELVGHGLALRLEVTASRAHGTARGPDGAPAVLRLACPDPRALGAGQSALVAPNGTLVELVPEDPPLVLPPLAPERVLARAADARWGTGRAGMQYRDLIPGRQGGRFIASHIRIPEGGPVPDYEHRHRVRFQVIYARRGWVRVVYEDQGPPFVMHAGDCVLQPPGIGHRVLESSPGLEVVELACPAEHETRADLELALPNATENRERKFGGQRFAHHRAADAAWKPWRLAGFEARDSGIAAATRGLASVEVVRRTGDAPTEAFEHGAELLFWFVLAGRLALRCEDEPRLELAVDDALTLPAGVQYALAAASDDLELLEVALPPLPPGRSATPIP
jgi:mannose-6-phosphate isomerase-like protein (cupin superfamily)